jgi:hypothetical protein
MVLRFFDTCACVVQHGDAPPHDLIRYYQFCAYHQPMGDAAAFAEIRAAHLAKAHVIASVRQGLGLESFNSAVEDPPLPVGIGFEQTPGLRSVYVTDAGLKASDKVKINTELAKRVIPAPVKYESQTTFPKGTPGKVQG